MSDTYNGTVEVRLVPPRLSRGDVRAASFEISEEMWRDVFDKLPRDRELYFIPQAGERAAHMQRQRALVIRHISSAIAAKLTEHLLKMVEAGDPIHGYSPEEWAEITRPQ